jgi:hypothetical protein
MYKTKENKPKVIKLRGRKTTFIRGFTRTNKMVNANAAFTNASDVAGSWNPLFQYEVMNMAKNEKKNIRIICFIQE